MSDERWLMVIGLGAAAAWWVHRRRGAGAQQVAAPTPTLLPPASGVLGQALHPGGAGNSLCPPGQVLRYAGTRSEACGPPPPVQPGIFAPWEAFTSDKCGCTARGLVNRGLGACACG